MVCGTRHLGEPEGEDAWGDSLRFTAYPYDLVVGKHFAYARVYDGTLGRMYAKDQVKQGLNGYLYCDNDPADYTDPEGELGHIAAAAGGGAIFGGISGFISSAVSQHMRGEKFSFRKALGAAAEGAVTGAARGAMMASGFGAVTMFAGDVAAGTVGNMLNRAISGERQNLGESLWEGALNAVGNAVFGKDPIGGSKGAGKKPINGFRDAYRRGARAAGVTTLVNDLAQMSGIVGGGEEQDSGSRYSSTLGRRTTGLDISARNTRGKQDPRTLCEPSDTFSGGISSQSTRGYRQTGGNKRKNRFNLGKLAEDVIVNSLIGGLTSTMYYGADRAVGAVSDGIRGKRNRQQKLGENESGSGTNIDNPVDLTDFRKNHILNNHRYGAGKPDKTEFPQNWSDKKILHYVSDVATDPNATWKMGRWNSPYAIDVREGIEIRVDFYPEAHPKYSGKISTAYPLNTPKNPPKGGEN